MGAAGASLDEETGWQGGVFRGMAAERAFRFRRAYNGETAVYTLSDDARVFHGRPAAITDFTDGEEMTVFVADGEQRLVTEVEFLTAVFRNRRGIERRSIRAQPLPSEVGWGHVRGGGRVRAEGRSRGSGDMGLRSRQHPTVRVLRRALLHTVRSGAHQNDLLLRQRAMLEHLRPSW